MHSHITAPRLLLLAMFLLTALAGAASARTTDVLRPDSIAPAEADTASTLLGEAQVTATRLIFVTKRDTTIYDMDAVVAAQGDMLNDILSQLPGLELRDGTLYFKGEKVDRLMVNGTDFVRDDTQRGLESLPAYIVKAVKAYRRMTDEAMHTGIDDGEREVVVDVQLRREYLGTWAGNVDAGYATDDYWLLRGFANNFSDNWRVSAYVGMTNTAQYQSTDAEGNWQENSGAGSSSGLTTFKRPGVSFLWKTAKPENKQGYFKVDGSVCWDYRGHNDLYRSYEELYLNEGSRFDLSSTTNRDRERLWHVRLNLVGSPTDSTYVEFRPALTLTRRDIERSEQAGRWNADPEAQGDSPLDSLFRTGAAAEWPADGSAVNASRGYNTTSRRGHTYAHSLQAGHRFTARGLRLGLRHQLTYSRDKATTPTLTEYAYFHDAATGDPVVNRNYATLYHTFTQQTFVDLNVPIARDWNLRLTYGNTTETDKDERDAYRLDRLGGAFADFDDYLLCFGQLPTEADWQMATRDASATLFGDDRTQRHGAEVRLLYKNERGLLARLQGSLRRAHERLDYVRGVGTPDRYTRRFNELFVEGQLRYENDSVGTFNLEYMLEPSTPEFTSLVDVTDDTDPLNITLGNPSLRQARDHSVNLEYDLSLPRMRYVSFQAAAAVKEDAVVARSVYDAATGVTTSQYVNVDGAWEAAAALSFNTPLDRKQRLSLNVSAAYGFQHVIGFATTTSTADARYTADHRFLRGWLGLSYRQERFFTQLSGQWTYTRLSSDYAGADGNDLFRSVYNWSVEWKMPWDLQLKSGLRLIHYAGQTSQGFDPLRCIWNASLAKSLLPDRSLTLKLEASDILSGRSPMSFYSDASSRGYFFSRSVERFFMLHVIWRFSFKPGGARP